MSPGGQDERIFQFDFGGKHFFYRANNEESINYIINNSIFQEYYNQLPEVICDRRNRKLNNILK